MVFMRNGGRECPVIGRVNLEGMMQKSANAIFQPLPYRDLTILSLKSLVVVPMKQRLQQTPI